MSVLVTGAAGFLGSHTVEALLARGERVIGVDNFDPMYPRSLKERNLECCRAAARRGGGGFEFFEADAADPAAMRGVLEAARPTGIIHLAAKAGVRPSLTDPAGYAHANVTGTAVVLHHAASAGVQRVVIASSSSVYGNVGAAGGPFREDQDADRPISPYAATKRACELIAHSAHALSGIPVACLRYFTVFGPRQRPDLAIARFLDRAGRDEPIQLYGDGSTERDYTFVEDAVAGTLAAYDRIATFGWRVWNIGSDRPLRLDEVVRVAGLVVGRLPRVERGPMQPGDVERTWADLGRARAELGYRPRTSFEDGVRRQWEWTREVGDSEGAGTTAAERRGSPRGDGDEPELTVRATSRDAARR